MLLSLRYKFLFIHVAKTGGTSVRAALSRYKWRDPYQIPLTLCSRISGLTGHKLGCKFPRHAKAIAAYEMLPRELFLDLFKFAFVRNPWDLQVSSFHHIRRERPHIMKGGQDFETFLNWKLDPSRPYHYIVDTSIELQSDYLIDLKGNIVVDFIGRYERFREDFEEICRRIGIAPPRLPHRRKAEDRTDYRRYYNEKTMKIVADRFKPDIDMFDYTF
jgi:hypothetical protein